MGSDRSGKQGIEYAEVQRVERLARQGSSITRIVQVTKLDLKTVKSIANGEHLIQRERKYARCKKCGAVNEGICPCDRAEPPPEPVRPFEHIACELENRDIPVLGRYRHCKPEGYWKVGLVTGLPGAGKTTVVRTWFPGAVPSYRWTSEPVGDQLVDSVVSLELVLATLGMVGLVFRDQLTRPYESLSAAEQDAVYLSRSLLSARRLVAVDVLPSFHARDRLRAVRRIARDVRAGTFGPSKRLICISTEPLATALSPDWHRHVTGRGRVMVKTC